MRIADCVKGKVKRCNLGSDYHEHNVYLMHILVYFWWFIPFFVIGMLCEVIYLGVIFLNAEGACSASFTSSLYFFYIVFKSIISWYV